MGLVKAAFTKEFISALDRLNFMICDRAGVSPLGNRKSGGKGESLEFSDFRDYSFGDDIRKIDWNSYGRLDRLFVKLFMEERQTRFSVFLDTSVSMNEPYEDKGLYSRMLAAGISYLILKYTDIVSIYTLSSIVNGSQTNLGSKSRFPALLDFLDNVMYMPGSDINTAVKQVKLIDKGVSVIISDFLLEEGFWDGIKYLRSKKQDVVLLHVLSEKEISPDYTGNISLMDSETNKRIDIHMTHEIKAEYTRLINEYINQMKDHCVNLGVKYALFDTGIPVIKALGMTLTN